MTMLAFKLTDGDITFTTTVEYSGDLDDHIDGLPGACMMHAKTLSKIFGAQLSEDPPNGKGPGLEDTTVFIYALGSAMLYDLQMQGMSTEQITELCSARLEAQIGEIILRREFPKGI